MGGTPDNNLISVADAKARLLEAGTQGPGPASLLAGRAAGAGALLLAGTLIGSRLSKKSDQRPGSPLLNLLARAGTVAAPLLMEQFVDGILRACAPEGGRSSGSDDESVDGSVA